MKIKVCGIADAANYEALTKAEPDMLGFIYHPSSPRYVGETPSRIGKAKRVGVFVNLKEEMVQRTIVEDDLDVVQLHGIESTELCDSIRESGVLVYKALAVGAALPVDQIDLYERYVDGFVLDTAGRFPGGNGVRFNWELLQEWPSEVPFLLSGGIGPEDAAAVLETYQRNSGMIGVDVNSRFEVRPGLKNVGAVEEFIKQLKDVSGNE